MYERSTAGRPHREPRMATDLTATDVATPSGKLPLKVYGVMALTTVLTFATLTTGYTMLFTRQPFA